MRPEVSFDEFFAGLMGALEDRVTVVIVPEGADGICRILGGELMTTLFDDEFYFVVRKDLAQEILDGQEVKPEGL